jgi:hypothetical protein
LKDDYWWTVSTELNKHVYCCALGNKLHLILILIFDFDVPAGPWFVGHFMTNHIGILFIWGTYVKGTLIPGSLEYFYGIFQVSKKKYFILFIYFFNCAETYFEIFPSHE